LKRNNTGRESTNYLEATDGRQRKKGAKLKLVVLLWGQKKGLRDIVSLRKENGAPGQGGTGLW